MKDKPMDYDRYVNNLPWPSKPRAKWGAAEQDMADAYRARDAEARREFENDLRADLGLTKLPDAVWKELYRQAWESGHASGFSEVAIYADDLADLVRATLSAYSIEL